MTIVTRTVGAETRRSLGDDTVVKYSLDEHEGLSSNLQHLCKKLVNGAAALILVLVREGQEALRGLLEGQVSLLGDLQGWWETLIDRPTDLLLNTQ